jgi:hypothetical protein
MVMIFFTASPPFYITPFGAFLSERTYRMPVPKTQKSSSDRRFSVQSPDRGEQIMNNHTLIPVIVKRRGMSRAKTTVSCQLSAISLQQAGKQSVER